jgi:metal-responsive CopG/Arc/MetJ family transcriptional regulator
MKTAISIPDNVYESAEKLAARLGKSRSQLYAQAVSNYLARYDRQAVTKQLNKVYADQESRLDEADMDLQLKSLPREEW